MRIILLLLFLCSCAGSKPADSISMISAEGLSLEVGQSLQLPDGAIITRVSIDSALHASVSLPKEKKPFINIQTYKDKRVDKSRENSDDLSYSNRSTEKTAKVVDKSKDKSKDKSRENSNNRHKEKSGGLPWWIWLLLVLAISVWIFWKWIKAQIP